MIHNFGFEYVKSLAHLFYGISDVFPAKAEGLDLWDAQPSEIPEQAKRDIPPIPHLPVPL